MIGALHAEHADTVLIAEAYWDMESELQNQGFDFCYDKRLYDRIVAQDTRGVREHLRADLGYQSKLLRFLENHDEPRIASRLGVEAEMAAAVAIATLPGGTLWHEGQFEGRRVRPPVFLSRRPDEQPRPTPRRLVRTTAGDRQPNAMSGADAGSCSRRPDGPTTSRATTCSPGPGAATTPGIWSWSTSPPIRRRPGFTWTPTATLPAGDFRFTDLLTAGVYLRDGSEIADLGLYVELQPWESYLFAVDRVPSDPTASVSP